MDAEETRFLTERHKMAESQLRSRGIREERILEAFYETPRERFVPPEYVRQAYTDAALPIGYGQTISQPYIVALMLQELSPQIDHRVLDVGVGSGYQTALLARLSGHVYGIERIEDLTERAMNTLAALCACNVTLCTGDGSLGWPEEAPFDRIICGAGAPDVPQAWIDQLAEGGRIVLPVGGPDAQVLLAVEKQQGQIRRREFCDVRFVRLIGRHGWPN